MARYLHNDTLEDTLALATIKKEKIGKSRKTKPTMYMGLVKVMEFNVDGSSVYEHFGYFREVSKQLSLPYQKLLDAFEARFRELVKELDQ